MIRSLKEALRQRGARTQQEFMERLEGELDGIYDLIAQVFSDERTCIEVLQSTLRRAMGRRKRERYERYARLWIFRLTVESIQRRFPRFVSERVEGQTIPFEFLTLEEKLCLLLRDRAAMEIEEIAAVLQMPAGRVGRSLAYAREKMARNLLQFDDTHSMTLLERVTLNRELSVGTALAGRDGAVPYLRAVTQVRNHVAGLPRKQFSEIENSVRVSKILPILAKPDSLRWQDLPWQYKLGLEAGALGLVGLIAVVVLPWGFSRINSNALLEGRYSEVFTVETVAQSTPDVAEISTDRLLASSELSELETPATEPDEFADIEFPSGDAYELGSAPIAPSKQNAAVYRMIVQSPSPKDLVPKVRSLFAERNVKERESSGRAMPGGVYFDGVTNVGSFPHILSEIRKMGRTKTYSNPGLRKNPEERARVIVWVQQI